MKEIAIITSLFDYPDHYLPTFYRKIIEEFNPENVHIIRNSGLITSGSYYDKLFFYKVVKLLEYLKEHILGKYEYVLFLDATDTAIAKPLKGIIEDFKSLDCSIVMGAEKGLWPPSNYVHLYEHKRKDSEYRYLNSGTYFGYTEKIINHLSEMVESPKQVGIDDQGTWTIQYLLHNDIIIDQESKFFFSTFNSNNKSFDSYIIHDNGGYNDETVKLVNNYL